jgi:hypothetical protein
LCTSLGLEIKGSNKFLISPAEVGQSSGLKGVDFEYRRISKMSKGYSLIIQEIDSTFEIGGVEMFHWAWYI